jgi:hypothetical protein
MTLTIALCFLAGVTVGWIIHKEEVEREKRKSAALAKVFEKREP